MLEMGVSCVMKHMYLVAEVAKALEASERTILRMLRGGVLKGTKKQKSWRVSQGSLKKWFLSALGIANTGKSCKSIENSSIKSVQSRGQVASLNRYILRETPVKAAGRTLNPRIAVLELQGSFRYFARRFANKNPALQDDLVQEMSLAVLQCDHDANVTFFIERGKSRALDYLEHERIRGMRSLDEVKQHPFAPEPISDEALLKLMVMAGVSVATIKYELGIAISPDIELDQL